MSYLLRYAAAAVTLLVLDGLWLTVVAASLYDRELGNRLADPPNLLAAAIFYLVYLAGVLHFVVDRATSFGVAARDGALFGLVAYATWGLTNLAVLANWPVALVPVDLAWGTVLTALVSLVAYAVRRRSAPAGA